MATRLMLPLLALGLLGPALAGTTIDEEQRHAYGANIGWLDARPDAAHGARFTEHVCSGYLYSANVGWIHLGSGTPQNGLHYSNTSATDYGVNLTLSAVFPGTQGALRGYAYGANIGWIAFEAHGNPRVDLETGRLLGKAWSANVGWIDLGELAGTPGARTHIAQGSDSDGDGMPDFWELARFGSILTAGAATDSDGDGVSDREEYLSDTDPLKSADHLRILHLALDRAATPDIAELTFSSVPSRRYRFEFTPSLAAPIAWTLLPGIFVPDSGPTTTRSFKTSDDSNQFLRVRAVRPLAP